MMLTGPWTSAHPISSLPTICFEERRMESKYAITSVPSSTVRQDRAVIAVILDTNAMHRDPWLMSESGTRLTDLAANDACDVILPDVVLGELGRQQHE